jgi:hypothetical protein
MGSYMEKKKKNREEQKINKILTLNVTQEYGDSMLTLPLQKCSENSSKILFHEKVIKRT